MRNPSKAMVAADQNIGTEVSGFLGFTTLRMLDIKIDCHDALVNFTYDANRFGRKTKN